MRVLVAVLVLLCSPAAGAQVATRELSIPLPADYEVTDMEMAGSTAYAIARKRSSEVGKLAVVLRISFTDTTGPDVVDAGAPLSGEEYTYRQRIGFNGSRVALPRENEDINFLDVATGVWSTSAPPSLSTVSPIVVDTLGGSAALGLNPAFPTPSDPQLIRYDGAAWTGYSDPFAMYALVYAVVVGTSGLAVDGAGELMHARDISVDADWGFVSGVALVASAPDAQTTDMLYLGNGVVVASMPGKVSLVSSVQNASAVREWEALGPLPRDFVRLASSDGTAVWAMDGGGDVYLITDPQVAASWTNAPAVSVDTSLDEAAGLGVTPSGDWLALGRRGTESLLVWENRAPIVDAVAPLMLTEGGLGVDVTITSDDPDGDTLSIVPSTCDDNRVTWSAIGLGVTFSPPASLCPEDALLGSTTCTVEVTDGSASASVDVAVSVTEIDGVPSISSLTVGPTTSIQLFPGDPLPALDAAVVASDDCEYAVNWRVYAQGNPADERYVASDAGNAVSFTAPAPPADGKTGTFVVEATVVDGAGQSESTTTTFTIARWPAVTLTCPPEVTAGQTASFGAEPAPGQVDPPLAQWGFTWSDDSFELAIDPSTGEVATGLCDYGTTFTASVEVDADGVVRTVACPSATTVEYKTPTFGVTLSESAVILVDDTQTVTAGAVALDVCTVDVEWRVYPQGGAAPVAPDGAGMSYTFAVPDPGVASTWIVEATFDDGTGPVTRSATLDVTIGALAVIPDCPATVVAGESATFTFTEDQGNPAPPWTFDFPDAADLGFAGAPGAGYREWVVTTGVCDEGRSFTMYADVSVAGYQQRVECPNATTVDASGQTPEVGEIDVNLTAFVYLPGGTPPAVVVTLPAGGRSCGATIAWHVYNDAGDFDLTETLAATESFTFAADGSEGTWTIEATFTDALGYTETRQVTRPLFVTLDFVVDCPSAVQAGDTYQVSASEGQPIPAPPWTFAFSSQDATLSVGTNTATIATDRCDHDQVIRVSVAATAGGTTTTPRWCATSVQRVVPLPVVGEIAVAEPYVFVQPDENEVPLTATLPITAECTDGAVAWRLFPEGAPAPPFEWTTAMGEPLALTETMLAPYDDGSVRPFTLEALVVDGAEQRSARIEVLGRLDVTCDLPAAIPAGELIELTWAQASYPDEPAWSFSAPTADVADVDIEPIGATEATLVAGDEGCGEFDFTLSFDPVVVPGWFDDGLAACPEPVSVYSTKLPVVTVAESVVEVPVGGPTVEIELEVKAEACDDDVVDLVFDLSGLPRELHKDDSGRYREGGVSADAEEPFQSYTFASTVEDPIALVGTPSVITIHAEHARGPSAPALVEVRFVGAERLARGGTVTLELDLPAAPLEPGEVVRVGGVTSSNLAYPLPDLRLPLVDGDLAPIDGTFEATANDCGARGRGGRASADEPFVITADGVRAGCPLSFSFLARKGLARHALKVDAEACSWGDDATPVNCLGNVIDGRRRGLGCAQSSSDGPALALLLLALLLAGAPRRRQPMPRVRRRDSAARLYSLYADPRPVRDRASRQASGR